MSYKDDRCNILPTSEDVEEDEDEVTQSEPGVQFSNTDFDFVSMAIGSSSSGRLSKTGEEVTRNFALSTANGQEGIDMSGLVDNEMNSQALALCKKYVLQHYFRLLQVKRP